MPIIVAPGGDAGGTVELRAVWLNAAEDPSDACAFTLITQLAPNKQARGEVRALANGRQRLISLAGQPRSYEVSLAYNDRTQVHWIEGHVGRIVCVRDPKGRKFFGVYLESPIEESTSHVERGDLTVTITEVSFSEAV